MLQGFPLILANMSLELCRQVNRFLHHDIVSDHDSAALAFDNAAILIYGLLHQREALMTKMNDSGLYDNVVREKDGSKEVCMDTRYNNPCLVPLFVTEDSTHIRRLRQII